MKLTAPLYMLRHGETAWNTERRMQGSKNSDLTARGRVQALAMVFVQTFRHNVILLPPCSGPDGGSQ